jgi:hypothetical protein
MAAAFECGRQYFYVANMRFAAIMDGALEISAELANNELQTASINRLKNWNNEAFPGKDIDLEKQFPTVDEQKFWSQVFESLAWRVFHRKWGNQETQMWQVGFIYCCHQIALMLTGLVWRTDRLWYPEPADTEGVRPDPMRVQR